MPAIEAMDTKERKTRLCHSHIKAMKKSCLQPAKAASIQNFPATVKHHQYMSLQAKWYFMENYKGEKKKRVDYSKPT